MSGTRRQLYPRALVAVVAVVAIGAAVLGTIERASLPSHHAPPTPAAEEPVMVGMSLTQAAKVAAQHGLTFRTWSLPSSAPAGTVIEQLSYQPIYLVVSTGPLQDRFAVLQGATVPPVHAECASTFTLEANGSAGPATCGRSQVNVPTWDYFAASSPPMLGLGQQATACALAQAYDTDLTPAMNATVYVLAKTYYGWRFGPGVAADLGSARGRTRLCATG